MDFSQVLPNEWNYCLSIMNIIYQLENPLRLYYSKEGGSDHAPPFLNQDEFNQLEEVCILLKPLNDFIDVLSRDPYPSWAVTFPGLLALTQIYSAHPDFVMHTPVASQLKQLIVDTLSNIVGSIDNLPPNLKRIILVSMLLHPKYRA